MSFTKDELRKLIAVPDDGVRDAAGWCAVGVRELAAFALAQVEAREGLEVRASGYYANAAALKRAGRVGAGSERGEDGIRACKAWHPSGTQGWFITVHERERLARAEAALKAEREARDLDVEAMRRLDVDSLLDATYEVGGYEYSSTSFPSGILAGISSRLTAHAKDREASPDAREGP